ncbi:hypothetical protein D9M72_216270 [compost metagenome]
MPHPGCVGPDTEQLAELHALLDGALATAQEAAAFLRLTYAPPPDEDRAGGVACLLGVERRAVAELRADLLAVN